MKKLLTLAVLSTALISSSAFSKTEGNYVGINLLSTAFESFDDLDVKHEEKNFGYGVDYKYAINFDNFFIAPGVFFDKNQSASSFKGSSAYYKDTLEYSYGAKLDLGYDISNKLAVFATLGHGFFRVSFDTDAVESARNTFESQIYGGGVKYSLNDNLDLNLAYEYSEYSELGDDVNTVKLGASYNF